MREQVAEVLEELKGCMARADRKASEVAEKSEELYQYYNGKFLAYRRAISLLETALLEVNEDEDEDEDEEWYEEWCEVEDDFDNEDENDNEVGYNPYTGCFDMDC